jgi:hypothetical protein
MQNNKKPFTKHASRKHSSRTSVGVCRKLKSHSQNMQAENTRPGRVLVHAQNSKPLAKHASRKDSSRTSVGVCRKLKNYSQNIQAENTRLG